MSDEREALGLQAVWESQAWDRLTGSDELLCECHPTTYREMASHLALEGDGEGDKTVPQVLEETCVAQGCRTCLSEAVWFVERLREMNKIKETRL